MHPARRWNAQGKGCAPGALGVCIGGDRTSGYVHAKEQLFRTLDDVNPDPRLAELEASIMGEVNKLGIGTMGFGGTRVADRLQDRRAEPAAGVLLRLGRLRLLGVPSPRRDARREDRARSRSGCIAIRRIRSRDGRSGGLPADRPGGRPAVTIDRRAGSLAQGRRRGACLRAACTPAAMRCTRT